MCQLSDSVAFQELMLGQALGSIVGTLLQLVLVRQKRYSDGGGDLGVKYAAYNMTQKHTQAICIKPKIPRLSKT